MSASKLALTDLASQLPGEVDMFICCASFEPRCRSVADSLDVSTVRSALIFRGGLSLDSVEDNFRGLWERLAPGRPEEVRLDTADPIESEDAVAISLKRALNGAGNRRILVDISTFTREFLFFLLNHLRRLVRDDDVVTLAYVGAAEYSASASADHIWLSQGVRAVRSVAGFPGEPMPSRPLHLIILGGFENERAGQLIEYYEPLILSVGYAPRESSITEEHHRVNATFHQRLVALYQDVHRFEFPPDDPVGTYMAVKRQTEAFSGANVVLSALNTKLSAVGAALAAFDNPSIQLCYAQADVYNYESYSRPAEEVHLFALQLPPLTVK